MWKEGVEFRRMIQYIWLKLYDFAVTSYTEVWIEILNTLMQAAKEYMSLPTRKCGLKLVQRHRRAGELSHFLHGSVD